MKRPISSLSDADETNIGSSKMSRRVKQIDAVLLDENLIYEVLKHVDDPPTLASVACVNKQWNKTADDERLWEMLCTKHSTGKHPEKQLRLVVTALGGFRKLFSLYLWPLLKHSSSSPAMPSTGWPCLRTTNGPARQAAGKKRWGKDEVNLSLSLLSISYYGKLSCNKFKIRRCINNFRQSTSSYSL